jgi:membrane associated rhomboid family serine protease
MFPLRDDIPSRLFPVVNLWLILINVACFYYEYSLGLQLEKFTLEYGFIPSRFLQQQAANPFDAARVIPVFSSMFLHGNLLHLASNMWMLWIFGDNVEDKMGHARYLAFYLLCGVCAVFFQGFAQPYSKAPMIGASGAISGVLGAYFILFPRARILTFIPIIIFFYLVEVPAFIFIGLWFVMQFLQGALQQVTIGSLAEGGVAWWAHVGGFVGGVLLVFLFRKKKAAAADRWLRS